MPIIQFSDADFLSGKILDKGIYPVELVEIGAPSASKSQKSYTYPARFRLTQEPNVGKELEVFFNTESSGNSILGTRQYMSYVEILKVVAAVEGIPYDQVPKGVDTDALKGRPLNIAVDVISNEGNLINQIVGFLPASYDGKVPF